MNNHNERNHSDDDEPQLDADSMELLNPKQRKPRTRSKEVFELFGKYPTFWLVNKTQREAADRLLNDRGIESLQAMITFYKANRDVEFCPQVRTPQDLENKWPNLLAFRKKQHG